MIFKISQNMQHLWQINLSNRPQLLNAQNCPPSFKTKNVKVVNYKKT